jgi:hypothetical protein
VFPPPGPHFTAGAISIKAVGRRLWRIACLVLMDEAGIDMSKHRPHTFEDLEDSYFDLIVTLSPEPHHKALEFTSTLAKLSIGQPQIQPLPKDPASAFLMPIAMFAILCASASRNCSITSLWEFYEFVLGSFQIQAN